MPIQPIGDLNTNRRLADEFVVTLARRRGPAGADEEGNPIEGELEYSVLVSCALLAGDIVIANWSAEDIWEQLTASQRSSAQSLLSAAESKVRALLAL